MISSRVRIWSFCRKTHLVFPWRSYNKTLVDTTHHTPIIIWWYVFQEFAWAIIPDLKCFIFPPRACQYLPAGCWRTLWLHVKGISTNVRSKYLSKHIFKKNIIHKAKFKDVQCRRTEVMETYLTECLLSTLVSQN